MQHARLRLLESHDRLDAKLFDTCIMFLIDVPERLDHVEVGVRSPIAGCENCCVYSSKTGRLRPLCQPGQLLLLSLAIVAKITLVC